MSKRKIRIDLSDVVNATYYFIPSVRKFANDCEWCYQFTGSRRQAIAIAEKLDARIFSSVGIEDLQERMHLAEGCSHPNCACSRDYDPSEDTCKFSMRDADEFSTELPEEFQPVE